MGRGQACLWGTTPSNHLTAPCLSFPTASCYASRLRVRALQQGSDPLCPTSPSSPDLGKDNPGPPWQGPPWGPMAPGPQTLPAHLLSRQLAQTEWGTGERKVPGLGDLTTTV